MKKLFSMIKILILLLVVIVICLFVFDYQYIFKGVRVVYFTGHTSAFIEDTPYFDTRVIHNKTPKPLPFHKDFNKATPTKPLLDFNKKLGTAAFLVLKNGQIWYEDYAQGFSEKSETNSFSMAKSITSALMFKAVEDGFIPSLDTKVVLFFPELKGKYATEVTVGDLSSMASGLDWSEQYISPFSITARANYQKDIRSLILDLEVSEKPGTSFNYLSGATQLLGMVIEKATSQTLTEYLSASFWQPMQMTQNAKWQLDSRKSGMEKAFCCIASNARDFAKWGLLWSNEGEFNGKQLLSKEYVNLATNPRFDSFKEYGYGLWLSNHLGKKIHYMRGILGQYVISIPEDDLVIVRLGHKRSMPYPNGCPGVDFCVYIDETYTMLRQLEDNRAQ